MKKFFPVILLVLFVSTLSFAEQDKKAEDIPEKQIVCLKDLMNQISRTEMLRIGKSTIANAYLIKGYEPCETLKILKRVMKHWDPWEYGRLK